ncbi:M64 family metallopeptidase [Sediminibacter sp. Hel_I_10]|uniref:T9SS type A sorting domain-containing protein n=1 Tax=Sediminibacter sp. Hel_I_10 TaxID=1392490 RepID=UPI00047B4005|nr:M64 family metallopeptidase [Sediminibacter sp. Hel_I_10]
MKHSLALLCFISIQFLCAQSFEVTQIKVAGAADKRINLVIMGDGYLASEFDDFEVDANAFVTEMFSQSPFLEYSDYFNVYIIKVPSEESGAMHPGTASDEPTGSSTVPVIDVNNYFGAAYDSFNIHRLLFSSNYALISTVLANNFPEYDQALILVNAPYYGGSGGTFPFASTDESAIEIAIHELGHSFSNLKDEYYPGDAQAAEAVNMTQDNNPETVKWKNWLGSSNVGIFPYGTTGTPSTWYRPHQNCKMRYLGVPFCSVCKEGIIERIHTLVSPIESYSPVANTLENPSLPLEFQLDLVQPLPNTLDTTWTLNSINFSSSLDNLSLLETDLVEGSNTLTALVTDNTALLRVDGHEDIHLYTVTWTIEVASLGISSITAESNHITINIYPNPAGNMLNVSIESDLKTDFSFKLISIDGKEVLSIPANVHSATAVDIERLSSGLYMLNVFQGNVLIGQKKLIKE